MSANIVYKATYSNVPVLETIIKGVPVMRRRKDDWLNATQILKVAGFDKPQRTRILEREVQVGEHEKVQGGYGKYQGTWIPFARGEELCMQYEIDGLMRPMLDYRPGSVSPPPAPKHITAASNRAPKVPGAPSMRGGRKKRAPREQAQSVTSQATSLIGRPPILPSDISDASIADDVTSMRSASPDRTDISESEDAHHIFSDQMHYPHAHISTYSEKLLEFFTDPKRFPMPEFLRDAPPDFNPNTTIDDEGHTALHWAAAMGLLEVVNYLLQAGADVTQGNAQMQTPLMRTVAFCNNYDLKTFPQVVQLLQDSVVYGDDEKRTVFHHIAMITTSGRSKQQAARYYAEQLLATLSKALPAQKLSSLINSQDRFGDTALHIAARAGAKKVWRTLLAYQANPNLPNEDGRTAQEYIDMHEANGRGQLMLSSSPADAGGGGGGVGGFNDTSPVSSNQHPLLATLHTSDVAMQTARRGTQEMTKLMMDLATAFDDDLRDLQDAVDHDKTTEREMRAEIDALKAKLEQEDGDALDAELAAAVEEEQEASKQLHAVVERSQARGLASLVKDEESKAEDENDEDTTEDAATRQALEQQLTAAIEARKVQVESIVAIFADAGAGEKMSDYRRLIALSTGVGAHEVDDMLGPIEELLMAGDESAMDGVHLDGPALNNSNSHHDHALQLQGLLKGNNLMQLHENGLGGRGDHEGDVAMAG